MAHKKSVLKKITACILLASSSAIICSNNTDTIFASQEINDEGIYADTNVHISIDKSELSYGESPEIILRTDESITSAMIFYVKDDRSSEERQIEFELTKEDKGIFKGAIDYLSTGNYKITGYTLFDGEKYYNNNSTDINFVINDPDMYISSDKDEVAFGEKIQICVKSDTILPDGYADMYLVKDGERVGIPYNDISDFRLSFRRRGNEITALINLYLSPGNYSISGIILNGVYTETNEIKFKVLSPNNDDIFDNVTFDKTELIPGDELGVTIDMAEPYISKKTEGGWIATALKEGGYGHLITYEKQDDGLFKGYTQIKNTDRNGIYAVRAIYGRYTDGEDVENVTYIEKMNSTVKNYHIKGSREDDNETGSGPGVLLSPSLLAAWDNDNISYREASNQDIAETETGSNSDTEIKKSGEANKNNYSDKKVNSNTVDTKPTPVVNSGEGYGEVFIGEATTASNNMKETIAPMTGDTDFILTISIFTLLGISLTGAALYIYFLNKNKEQ